MFKILRIIINLYRLKDLTFFNLIKNCFYNCKVKHLKKNAILLLGDKCDFRIENKGQLLLNSNFVIGKKYINKTHYCSWLWLMRNARIEIYDNFTMYEGASIHMHEGGNLILRGGYMNENSSIVCESTIDIGKGVAIAPGVLIRDCDSHTVEGNKSVKPIHIGEHVWIGSNTIVLKGVNIGDNCVIGAGSVVTKDIPSNCLAVGNPARVIKHNIKWH